MKQLGLVRAGSRRERSALTKSEARKFINQLIGATPISERSTLNSVAWKICPRPSPFSTH
jgi:hypothetical protein